MNGNRLLSLSLVLSAWLFVPTMWAEMQALRAAEYFTALVEYGDGGGGGAEGLLLVAWRGVHRAASGGPLWSVQLSSA